MIAINGISKIEGTSPHNDVNVVVQDSTSPAIASLFSKEVSAFTLASDTPMSTIDTLYYTFTATTGHGLSDDPASKIILLDIVGDREFIAIVKEVTGDVIRLDRPIDHVFPASTSLCRIITQDMNVDGSVTPQIFTIRAGVNPTDYTAIALTMLNNTAMDDSTFGGLGKLTNGLVLRIVDGYQKTIFNFKTNADIKSFMSGIYSDKAPSGFFSFNAEVRTRDTFGVVLRVSGNSAIQWIVQDDLRGLDELTSSVMGSGTVGEE